MRSADEIAVLNLGASGVNVSQQLERLRTLTIGPQDVVVFYDGTADAMQGLYYANFDGWIVGENRKHLDSFIARNRASIEVLARWSRFFDWLFARTTNYLPEHLKYPEQIKALALESRQKFLAGLIESDRYVRSKGATLIHVYEHDLRANALRLSRVVAPGRAYGACFSGSCSCAKDNAIFRAALIFSPISGPEISACDVDWLKYPFVSGGQRRAA